MLKVLSLFSGIGAFEKALDNLECPYELVNFCEFDKYAVKSYCAIHDVDESKNLGDITKVDEKKLPKDIDILTYGFPCQDISLAGKQKGLFNEDGTQTRSGLFFEAMRIIEETKPKIAIAENVKNLLSKKFNAQFQVVLASLESAGYNNYYQVLNAKNFGVPQNRERVFIVSIRKDIDNGLFEFPKPFPLKVRLKDVLEEVVDEKYYLTQEMVDRLFTTNFQQNKYENRVAQEDGVVGTLCARDYKDPKCVQLGQMYPNSGNPQAGRVYAAEGISPTMDTCSGGNRMPKVLVREATKKGYAEAYEGDSINLEQPNSNTRRGRVGKQMAQTLTTTPQQGAVVGEPKIERVDIPQTVKVRKYPVDVEKLCDTLRKYKDKCGWTNKELAEELELPLTKVEHWFRKDQYFAIPEPEIWEELKYLLEMDDVTEFDESVMTFEEQIGVFEKSERHYHVNGIAPTLTSGTVEKIVEPLAYDEQNGYIRKDGTVGTIMTDGSSPKKNNRVLVWDGFNQRVRADSEVVGTLTRNCGADLKRNGQGVIEPSLRIRKLTPKECFRLMGFDDESFHRAEAVNSNTQLYKQAGNSIVVDVLEELFCRMLDENGGIYV